MSDMPARQERSRGAQPVAHRPRLPGRLRIRRELVVPPEPRRPRD